MERWREGPIGRAAAPAHPAAARLAADLQRPPAGPTRTATRRRPSRSPGSRSPSACAPAATAPGALVLLADGRYAVTGDALVAVGGRRADRRLGERRARRRPRAAARRAWWQEVAGVLNAPAGWRSTAHSAPAAAAIAAVGRARGRPRRRPPSRRRTARRPRRRRCPPSSGRRRRRPRSRRRRPAARRRSTLSGELGDERLAAPAGVDGHAEDEVGVAAQLGDGLDRGARVDRDARQAAELADRAAGCGWRAASPRRGR